MTESRILQRKETEKHNNSQHSRFNSHFKVLLISSLAFSYKHHNQNTFVCFDFQNSTTPKDKKISLQLAEVTGMLQLLVLYEDHPAFADFLESTELAVQICPTSVLGGGKPKIDGCHSHLWLKERISSYATRTHHTAVYTQSCFQKGKGWQHSWTPYAWKFCYLSEKKKTTSAVCKLCGWAQYLGDQSYDFPALASRELGVG